VWMHFSGCFGHPEVYIPVIPALRLRRNHSGVFARTDFRLPGDGRGDRLHRV